MKLESERMNEMDTANGQDKMQNFFLAFASARKWTNYNGRNGQFGRGKGKVLLFILSNGCIHFIHPKQEDRLQIV